MDIKEKYFKSLLDEIKYSAKAKNFKEKGTIKLYREEVYTKLSNFDCKLFACGQNKYLTYQNGLVESKHDTYRLGFQHMIYLINSYMFLHKIHEPVVVFIDTKEENHDDMMYESYIEALNNNKLYPNFDKTVFSPTLNVVASKYTIGAQVADLVCCGDMEWA